MILKYSNFINESNNQTLFYYALDWDDNILHMPTIIHMDKLVDGEWQPEDVSTSTFAIIRKSNQWRFRNDNAKDAFSEFHDDGIRKDKAFLEDLEKSVNKSSYGPSWNTFLKCLVNGNLFAIITTRSHEPKTIRKGVEWIIYNCLSNKEQDKMVRNLLEYHGIFGTDVDYVIDQYLDNCYFMGVGDPINNYVKNVLKITDGSIEERKSKALIYFKKKMLAFGRKIKSDIKIGFSDDDLIISNAMVTYMGKEKKLDDIRYKTSKANYYVYDTSNPKKITQTKI